MKYKVGNKVKVKSIEWYNENKNKYGTIQCNGAYFQPTMSKFCENILTIKNIDKVINAYIVEENSYYWVDDMFEGLAKDTTQSVVKNIIFSNENYTDKVELCLGDDYEIIIENGKTFVQKKKPKYPTTYEECCKVLNVAVRDFDILYNMLDTTEIIYSKKLDRLLNSFRKILTCRDAYWKIAGEEMGLDKPWDATYGCGEWGYWLGYSIIENKIFLQDSRILVNHTWVFPSAEMRDTFYENFKDLIENCKELL